ncbi:42102_t:CDS:2, partial [Gigaspora margarita]
AFSVIYSNVWLEDPRFISDNESQEWIRSGPTTCTLKRIENSQFICQEYLDNVRPDATKACTNCQEKHAKCSGRATCKRCTQHNLLCTFIDSGKKRGPKKNGKHPEQVYALFDSENDVDEASMLSSDICNSSASTLSSTLGYPQQPNNTDKFTLYSDSYEKLNIDTFQEAGPSLYNVCVDNGYVMPSNNLLDNNLFIDNYYMLAIPLLKH